MIYVNDSIGISCPIKVDGVTVTTTYAENDVMNDASAGKGKAWLTVFKSDGTIATDVSGLSLENQYMSRGSSDGVAVYTIGSGLPAAGKYTIQPFYGVNGSSGNLDWRKQAIIHVEVVAPAASTDVPVS